MNKAKKIFFNYIGSRFFMDRDGIYPEYKKFNVLIEEERKWLNELTELKLAELNKKGNWNSVFFFNHHSEFKHLNKILESEPLGKYWEKCAFLEELYKMTKLSNLSKVDKKRVLDYISEKGNSIFEKTKTPERISKLLNKL